MSAADESSSDHELLCTDVAVLGISSLADYTYFKRVLEALLFGGQFSNTQTGERYDSGIAETAKAPPLRCESLITGVAPGTDALAARFAHDALLPCKRVPRAQRATDRQYAYSLLASARCLVLFYDTPLAAKFSVLLAVAEEYDVPVVPVCAPLLAFTWQRCVPLGVDAGVLMIDEPVFVELHAAGATLVVVDDERRQTRGGGEALAAWLERYHVQKSAQPRAIVRFASRWELNRHQHHKFDELLELWRKALAGRYTIEPPLKMVGEHDERQWQNDAEAFIINIDAPAVAEGW